VGRCEFDVEHVCEQHNSATVRDEISAFHGHRAVAHIKGGCCFAASAETLFCSRRLQNS